MVVTLATTEVRSGYFARSQTYENMELLLRLFCKAGTVSSVGVGNENFLTSTMSYLPRFKSFSSFHAVPGALRSHPTIDPYMVAYTRTD